MTCIDCTSLRAERDRLREQIAAVRALAVRGAEGGGLDPHDVLAALDTSTPATEGDEE